MHIKPFPPQGYCDPNDQTCFGPFSLPALRSATSQIAEDPYLAAACIQLEAPPTRASAQEIYFSIGQTMGYLAAKGAEIQLSPQTAHLLANDPHKAASELAAKVRGSAKFCGEVHW